MGLVKLREDWIDYGSDSASEAETKDNESPEGRTPHASTSSCLPSDTTSSAPVESDKSETAEAASTSNNTGFTVPVTERREWVSSRTVPEQWRSAAELSHQEGHDIICYTCDAQVSKSTRSWMRTKRPVPGLRHNDIEEPFSTKAKRRSCIFRCSVCSGSPAQSSNPVKGNQVLTIAEATTSPYSFLESPHDRRKW
ncbi:hypothetical protein I317_04425 [Kwoniella heveanensis CBS 569]|nr:hypothetical protein I317_04425 [Kwoniella heveanensis CBS 569]